jgi:hypothetical protein
VEYNPGLNGSDATGIPPNAGSLQFIAAVFLLLLIGIAVKITGP